ncbi:MAG: phage major capsid protein [Rhizobiales bacterium]|nr:phage major capsid protein [Hyphomicrobiales bacterium]
MDMPMSMGSMGSTGVTSLEVVEAFDEFMQSFEAFKQANDERLSQIERQVTADVLTEEKMNRINAALDQQKHVVDHLLLKQRRPSLGHSASAFSAGALEHKAAFEGYMRKGQTATGRASLSKLEEKALSIGSDPDGGYLVPHETETEIGRLLAEISPIRAISAVRQISTSVYKKPFTINGPAVGWVGETEARAQTAAPMLDELEFQAMELFAQPAATGALLDDAAINVEEWLAQEVQIAFAEQESAAFVNGNGDRRPRGFLNYPRIANADWSWGNIGTVATGAAGAFASSDALIDLVYELRSGYRQNAHFVMNRRTQADIRKLKDADGNYLWAPATSADGKPTLMNFPIAESEDMPDIAAGSAAVAFGDFGRGYLVVDRVGVRVLRDPFSAKPYVLFYTTKRVGGGVQDFDAIKLLTFSAA